MSWTEISQPALPQAKTACVEQLAAPTINVLMFNDKAEQVYTG